MTREVIRRRVKDTLILRCKDDSLIIMREGCNNYTIHFMSCTGNSWIQEQCWFRDVYSAVWTFYNINFEPGWFEY